MIFNMKKRVLNIYLILLITGIFLSATYLLSTKEFPITGMDTATHDINLTIANTAPVIFNVTNPGAQSITEAGVTNVTFWFRVNEPNGMSDLVNASSYGELNRTGEVRRINSTCAFSREINATVAEYQCRVVGLWWFDGSGEWSMNASIRDAGNSVAINNSVFNNFTLTETTGFVMGPSALTWATMGLNDVNQTSTNDPMLLNNTGNHNTTSGNIQNTVINLIGETTAAQYLNASNFTIDLDTGTEGASGAKECLNNASTGARMLNNTAVNITGAFLNRGNFTINQGNITSGQEELYYCLDDVSSTATSTQSYSTSAGGAWTIRVG